MKSYKGVVAIAGGAYFGFQDIDPPERQGYANVVQRIALTLTGDDTLNDGYDIMMGLSVKVPVRTDYAAQDEGLPADIVALTSVSYKTLNAIIWDNTVESYYAAEHVVFMDTIRVFLASPLTLAAGKDVTAHYVMEIDEIKLTDALRAQMVDRAYS